MARHFIGLMSGTSLDGADGVLVEFGNDAGAGFVVRAHVHHAFSPALAAEFLALNACGGNELHRAALAGNALAECYAGVVESLLRCAGLPRQAVSAIGAHGQTVRHRPAAFDGTGYTVQVNAPALLAERCAIPVVADFRSRDVAAGGQGAPLVPVFHRAVFGRAGEVTAIVNLGGIANLTIVDADGGIRGFDCGPANALLDRWCARHTGRPYDDEGRWAAEGTVLPDLLDAMLAEPYFAAAPPKSTGRDSFDDAWLDAQLHRLASRPATPDVQRTLVELTARSVAADVRRYAPEARELLVCGGGALNGLLMDCLAAALRSLPVHPTDARGLPSMQVEACAFAWLARAHLDGERLDLSDVTGARGARVLGALYPA